MTTVSRCTVSPPQNNSVTARHISQFYAVVFILKISKQENDCTHISVSDAVDKIKKRCNTKWIFPTCKLGINLQNWIFPFLLAYKITTSNTTQRKVFFVFEDFFFFFQWDKDSMVYRILRLDHEDQKHCQRIFVLASSRQRQGLFHLFDLMTPEKEMRPSANVKRQSISQCEISAMALTA